MTLEGPCAPYDFTWELVNATNHISVPTSTLYIKLYYEGQYFGYDSEVVNVTFADPLQIYDSVNGYDIVDTGFEFYMSGQEYQIKHGHWIGFYIFVFCYALLLAISLGLVLLGFSGWIAVDMVCTLQMIHLIPVCRLYLPSVLLIFFKMFRFCNFESIAFGEWQFNRAVDQFGYTVNHLSHGYNFEKMGYYSKAFFSQTTDILVL